MRCKLTPFGILKVSGLDAQKFLQGQLTYHLEKLAAHQLVLAAHCNPQGRMLSLFYLTTHENEFYLCMPQSLLTSAENALKKYSLFYKAALARSDLQISMTTANREMLPNAQFYADFAQAELNFRFIFHAAATKEPADFVWDKFQIEHLLPSLVAETSGHFLPQELNLEYFNALSFDKGCYTGQEIIARLHYRGKIKSQLIRAEINTTTLTPGMEVYYFDQADLKKCGEIVAVYKKSAQQFMCLLVCESAHIAAQHLVLKSNPQEFFNIYLTS